MQQVSRLQGAQIVSSSSKTDGGPARILLQPWVCEALHWNQKDVGVGLLKYDTYALFHSYESEFEDAASRRGPRKCMSHYFSGAEFLRLGSCDGTEVAIFEM